MRHYLVHLMLLLRSSSNISIISSWKILEKAHTLVTSSVPQKGMLQKFLLESWSGFLLHSFPFWDPVDCTKCGRFLCRILAKHISAQVYFISCANNVIAVVVFIVSCIGQHLLNTFESVIKLSTWGFMLSAQIEEKEYQNKVWR